MEAVNPQPAPEERLLLTLAERAHRARLRSSKNAYPPLEEARPPLTAIVRRYLAADAPERARMRELVKRSLDLQTWLLWSACDWARGLVQAPELDTVELALGALSLEDKVLDFRDTYCALGLVWHRAHRANLDPRPAVERVAALSSAGDEGFAAFLKGLESSAFLTSDVLPHLDREALAYEHE